jgi:hypothetical protein
VGRNPKETAAMMFTHDIHLSHTRHPISHSFAVEEASSSVSITSDSNDLVEAFAELLSRMPPDLYAALTTAMKRAGRIE